MEVIFSFLILIAVFLFIVWIKKASLLKQNVTGNQSTTANPNRLIALNIDYRKPPLDDQSTKVISQNDFPEKIKLSHRTTDFVVFDFETANMNRSSACALGIVVVKNLEIIETKHYYISPQHNEYFLQRFVDLHEITWDQVYDKPFFNKIWTEIKDLFEANLLIAYNASFDLDVLTKTLNFYGITLPNLNYACAWEYSKKHFPNLNNYKLSSVCQHLNIELQHHQAESDAKAAAEIIIYIVRGFQRDFKEKHPDKPIKPITAKAPAIEIPQELFNKVRSEMTDIPTESVELAKYLETIKRNIRRQRKNMIDFPDNSNYNLRYMESIAKYKVVTGKDYE